MKQYTLEREWKGMGKVRMADIAERVGVSTVTVHNALAGNKGVSDEMRQKIQTAAQEMGYKQITAAVKRERNKGGMRKIGVIISEKYLADYTTFYWKMYQELALVATDKSCMAAVEILKHEMEDQFILPRIQEEETVDALIVMGEISREYIHFMKKHTEMPVIFLDFYDKELSEDAVIADNFHGMYLMTEYLFEHGFTKMAYVGSVHATSSIMDRYCGFYKSQLEHGQSIPEEWVIEDRNEKGDMKIELPEEMPQAFVCNCDLAAGMVVMELEKQGYRVPEDVSVVGFDNFLYPGFPDKKITSYEVNIHAMAKVALEKALKQMRNPASGRGLSVVSGKIVEKESVAKLPGEKENRI